MLNKQEKCSISIKKLFIKTLFLAWTPSCIIGILYTLHNGDFEKISALYEEPIAFWAIGLLAAPLAETYMMKYIFIILEKTRLPNRFHLLVSTVAWIGFHYNYPLFGIHAGWAFYVMGKSFLKIRPLGGHTYMYFTMLVHFSMNLSSWILYSYIFS